MSLLKHPGAGWSIRAADLSDKDRIETIFRQCLSDLPWRRSVEDEVVRLRQSAVSAHFFVAEEPSAGVIGFLTVEQLRAYVPHLFVDPDWRFCGVAEGLLKVAREATGQPLKLDVDLKNKPARAAYAALGWRVLADAEKAGRRRTQIRMVGP